MTGGGGWATLRPVAPSPPSPCALFWATKAVKIADYNRGFPSHNCLLLLQLFPPVRFVLLSLCSSLLFSSFFSSDTFTLSFGHLSPLRPFSPLPPVATPVTRDTATFSFLARLSFHFAASSSASALSCFYFYSTRAKTFVFVRAFCMSFPSPPLSFVSFTPTPSPTLPTTIIPSLFSFPSASFPSASSSVALWPPFALLFCSYLCFCLFCSLFRCAFYFRLLLPEILKFANLWTFVFALQFFLFRFPSPSPPNSLGIQANDAAAAAAFCVETDGGPVNTL